MIGAITFETTPAIRFAAGAAAHLGPLAAKRLGSRILFVTDAGLTGLGLNAPALARLAQGAAVTVFDAVEADPSRATLMAAVAAGQEATGEVGFGGGSSLDVAKLAALLLGSDEDLDAAWGVGLARGPCLPLVLVPTTAGTGSEVTPVAIVTVEGSEKRGVSSPLLLPDLALLDPDLTLGLPAATTAATGLDAMVHAIEAYTSRSPNASPVSRALACEALRLLGANIERAVAVGGDRAARGAMLLGAMLAGQAFANARLRRSMRWPIRSAGSSTCRMACRMPWSCRMCCASMRRQQQVNTPRSRPLPGRARIWRTGSRRSRPASACPSACGMSASRRRICRAVWRRR